MAIRSRFHAPEIRLLWPGPVESTPARDDGRSTLPRDTVRLIIIIIISLFFIFYINYYSIKDSAVRFHKFIVGPGRWACVIIIGVWCCLSFSKSFESVQRKHGNLGKFITEKYMYPKDIPPFRQIHPSILRILNFRKFWKKTAKNSLWEIPTTN